MSTPKKHTAAETLMAVVVTAITLAAAIAAAAWGWAIVSEIAGAGQ